MRLTQIHPGTSQSGMIKIKHSGKISLKIILSIL
nr:MAG TPA: hypothetical protein [Caudoviricetes sp.]